MTRETSSYIASFQAMAAEPPKASAPAPDDAHIHFKDPETGWYYIQYSPEQEPAYLPAMRELISRDLSEPYSIYVYRYFLYSWPDLCFLCISPDNKLLGVVINKLEPHTPPSKWGYLPDPNNPPPNRGYIAMLATHAQYRKRGIASKLVKLAISAMKDKGADEVVLETEVMNEASLRLYGRLGFVRSKKYVLTNPF